MVEGSRNRREYPLTLGRIEGLGRRGKLAIRFAYSTNGQAYNDFTSFAAFADDALTRVRPEDIRKKGRVPNTEPGLRIGLSFWAARGYNRRGHDSGRPQRRHAG